MRLDDAVFNWPELVFYITLLFVASLAAVVFTQILNGDINTRHLLHARRADGKMYFSPERVQLLVFTIWIAFSYLLDAIDQRGSGKLPDVSTETLALLGGSHAIYLGGKAYAMLLKKIVKGEK
jgi:hypothetical protein